MNSNDFLEARIKLNLKVGDRIKVKLDTEEEIYITFKLLDCNAMNGFIDDYINIGEIGNRQDWMEPGYWHLQHIEKIISKL